MSLAMLNTKVLITGIIGICVIVVSLIGAVVYLSSQGTESSTLLTLVATLVSTFNLVLLVLTRSSAKETTAAVAQLQSQTNGTQQKLIDAAIAAPSPEKER